MEFLKKNIKWVTIGISVLAIIGLFLPFATVSVEFWGQKISESVSFIEGDGAIVFATVVVAGVLVILNKDVFALAPLGVGVGITLYDAFNGISEFDELKAIYDGVKLSYGIGFYLVLIGLILAIIAILYNLLGIKKMTISEVFQNALKGNRGYNQPMQPQGQVVYAQYGNTNNVNYGYNGMNNNQGGYDSFNQQQGPMMQNNYNNDFNVNNNVSPQVGMPTANVDTNIFNQAPVAQPNMQVQNQTQPVDMMQPVNQPVMNTMPQQPVQDFSNPVPSTITCPQCRATLNSGMSFCNQCGSKLN